MAETVRVVVDAMGGDNAPAEPVKAAVEAVAEREDIDVILTGRQDVICLLYTSPSPRDYAASRMPSSA